MIVGASMEEPRAFSRDLQSCPRTRVGTEVKMDPRRALLWLSMLASLVPAARAQDCLLAQGKLVPQSTSPQQMFGVACAVYRSTLATLTSAGEVAVYTRSGGVWSLQQRFAANWASGTHHGGGQNLSLDRDTLVVGDPNRYAPPSAFVSGAADVYVRTGTSWVLQATLTAGAGDIDADDQFGASLVLRGDRLIVGAQGDDAAAADAGAAYSFVRSGGTWALEAKLVNAGAAAGQLLGTVDFDGTRCIVGGSGGRTCIFALQGTGWTQEAELPFSALRVGIDGSIAALRGSSSCSGTPLRTFERIGATWTLAADVLTDTGGDLALRRQRVVAGRPGNPICSPVAHAARIYSRHAGSWQIDAAAGPEVTGNTGFGRAVAFDGATLLVGDPLDDQVATDAGAVWVFAVGPDGACPIDYCTAKPNSLQCTPWSFSSGTPSASAGSGFVLGAGHVLSFQTGMALYGTSGRANLPFLGGTLCIASPILRGPIVTSGGNGSAFDCSGLLAFDMNAFAAGSLGGNPSPLLRVPGTVIDVQWWARDPGFAPPDNVQLGAGQEYTVLP